MTKKIDFAAVLVNIETAAAAVEDVAKMMLTAIKQADAKTLDQFNAMVSEAYGKNGWSQTMGRPVEGSTLKPAPDAVKYYVSTLRRAFRYNLDVANFQTMSLLRSAIRQHAAELNTLTAAPKAPELVGVTIANEHEMTGALWHDLPVLWNHLPQNSQEKFEQEVRKLLTRYIKAAPEFLKLVS